MIASDFSIRLTDESNKVTQLLKIAIGLAIKSELYHGRINNKLSALYNNPDQQNVHKYYSTMINSEHHVDREVAFWLELAIPKSPERIDLAALIDVLQKMEVILYDLLLLANPNLLSDLNDWLNYISNIPHMLESNRGIDAKRLISQAFDSSQASTIEVLKRDPKIGRKLQILQQETQYLYHQILRIPLRLVLPKDQQESILTLQNHILELLKIGMKQRKNIPNYQYALQRLERIQTYLMKSDVPHHVLEKEFAQAINYLHQSYRNNELAKSRSQYNEIIQNIQLFSNSL
jgi:hypothetical protein